MTPDTVLADNGEGDMREPVDLAYPTSEAEPFRA